MSRSEAGPQLKHFLNLVDKILPEDKYDSFIHLLRFPLPTVALTERIFTALEKIFDGRNPIFKYDFANESHAEDWEEYRANALDEPTFWKTEAFDAMKTKINSVMIIDLPQEQEGDKPEPYCYFLDINEVIDFEMSNDTNVFEWIIFKQPEDRIAVFCDGYFRVFNRETESTSLYDIASIPVIETEHDLGYCPARFFWSTPISRKEIAIKKSPVTNQLGRLDSLLFYDVANEDLQVYARYPIYSGFASDCDYEHKETGATCKRGYIHNREGLVYGSAGNPKQCPICSKKKLNGPGSFVEFDPPSLANDHADLRNPVQITSIPKDSLDYNNVDLEARRQAIYDAVTGNKTASAMGKEAMNEDQIRAIHESLEAALMQPQSNIEQAWEWANITEALLRYGSESFKGASISLGTEHYIMTPAEIMRMYDFAKKAAFSVSTLDMLEEMYFETEFKNNPEQLYRQRIIINLDPFRHLSINEVSGLYQGNSIGFNEFIIKTTFSTMITRFERENASLIEFGSALDFGTKIKRIKEQFIRYAEEMKPEPIPALEPGPAPQPQQ